TCGPRTARCWPSPARPSPSAAATTRADGAAYYPVMARAGMTVPLFDLPLSEHRAWFEELIDLGYTELWSSEADGTDAFTPLTLAAAWAPTARLGTAIVPAYTRGPAVLAQTAAAMAEAAPGRFVLGVGTSSNVIVQQWN